VEHNLKDDAKGINSYKDKTDRQAGEVVELSATFCDNLVLSGLTTTSRTSRENCADCGRYTTRARECVAERKISAKAKPVDITTPDPEDIAPGRIRMYRNTILKREKIKGALNYKILK
jgi:hypothetical protein